ncbi:MAG: trypsin-like serine protease [Beijerinckiaceae bacterium]|nr:trypsin-like serine protease [Beijerinckiaceae bacterium]
MFQITRFAFIPVLAAMSSAAFAASGDAPVSSDGRRGAAPAEATITDAKVKPSLGTGATDPKSMRAAGAEPAAETSFPPNGLSTVAYGKGGPAPESIINWDSRLRQFTRNYPTRAIVFIEYNGAHLCTGWLYAPHIVATAGHCVHTGGSSGSWRRRTLFRVYPGRDGAVSPYGSCTAARLHSVVGWTQNDDPAFDYGAIRLNCTVGNTTGWFGMYTPGAPNNTPAIISGYPGDKPRDQWLSADKIRQTSNERIAYRMDTIGGHSGSPIWHDRNEALAATGAWAFGVHNYGVGSFGTNANSAARLTAVRIQNYVNWRDAP